MSSAISEMQVILMLPPVPTGLTISDYNEWMSKDVLDYLS